MKLLVLAAALFAAAPVLADNATTPAPSAAKEVLTCTVQSSTGSPQVSLNVSVQSDTSADFIVVGLNDKGTVSRLFTQADKDTVSKGMAAGSLGFLLLEENFTSENGVIRNAGFAIFTKGENGYTGLLSAKGNLYPLTCTAK